MATNNHELEGTTSSRLPHLDGCTFPTGLVIHSISRPIFDTANSKQSLNGKSVIIQMLLWQRMPSRSSHDYILFRYQKLACNCWIYVLQNNAHCHALQQSVLRNKYSRTRIANATDNNRSQGACCDRGQELSTSKSATSTPSQPYFLHPFPLSYPSSKA